MKVSVKINCDACGVEIERTTEVMSLMNFGVPYFLTTTDKGVKGPRLIIKSSNIDRKDKYICEYCDNKIRLIREQAEEKIKDVMLTKEKLERKIKK